MNTITLNRKTNETDINITILLNEKGKTKINTPIPFFNHMLEAFAFYADISLVIDADGDIEVDDHHLIEDLGLSLGKAFNQLIDKQKIARFATNYIPMDEALSRVVIDISNRPTLVYQVNLTNEKIGNFTLCNLKEFFIAFVNQFSITLHITNLYGENDHHIIESVFKALGKTLKTAIRPKEQISSTKGVL